MGRATADAGGRHTGPAHFNIGSVIRTAKCPQRQGFHLVGKRGWDRRGAMVIDRYQHEFRHPEVADLRIAPFGSTRSTTHESRGFGSGLLTDRNGDNDTVAEEKLDCCCRWTGSTCSTRPCRQEASVVSVAVFVER